MRPVPVQVLTPTRTQHASSSFLRALSPNLRPSGARRIVEPWICPQCWHHGQSTWSSKTGLWQLRKAVQRLGVSKGTVRNATTEGKPANQDSLSPKRKALPSQEEGQRSNVARRFSHVMDNVQSNIFIAGQRLNDLTGYSGIEALKKEIEEQEKLVRTTRSTLLQAKEAYTTAIAQRSASQREVNELLQRKHAWSPQDLERFTSLYRSDHANEQAEAMAQEAVAVAERKAEEGSTKLSASILARYHEEQIWSDKIRRMSTWGTWGLMGVNVLLFLVFQIGVEPWRRKRLVKGFEEKVLEALEREGQASNAATGAALAALQASHTSQATRTIQSVDSDAVKPVSDVIDAIEEVVSAETGIEPGAVPEALMVDIPKPPSNRVLGMQETYIQSIKDLFSERQITLRKLDLTTATLEGAFAGIALASIIGALLRNR